MGQAQSGEADGLLQAVDDVKKELDAQPKSQGVKLYKYIPVGDIGEWELVTASARPQFYDALEDQNNSKHDWHLEVDGTEVDVRVDESASFVLDWAKNRVTFRAGLHVYAMRVQDGALFRSFGTELGNKQFYNTYNMENSEAARAKHLGADFADRLFNFDQAKGAQTGPMEVDAEPEQHSSPHKERAAIQEEEEDDPIVGVIMGANDNSYLLKSGGKFGVLRNVVGLGVEDKGISFTLTPAKGSSSSSFATPSRVLLAQGERKMHLLTPDHPNKLHHADVETGKIVNTFSFQKDHVDIPIKEITHDTKSSQMEESSTFLGLDNNRLCRWDLRAPTGRVAESPIVNWQEGKDYTRGTNFNCMATSGDGFVVVGAQDGQIRLYSSKTLTRANTAIPGMGAPITAIDVTYDGKWVVATTAQYLMVVKTTFQNDKGAASNAFTSRMGGRGCMPRLLRLRPEDVARTACKPLLNGKFSWITESGQSERWIVVSCGKYHVAWNFAKVKSSSTETMSFGGLPTNMDYVMSVAKEEEVVAATFQHRRYEAEEAASSIVVATQRNLFTID